MGNTAIINNQTISNEYSCKNWGIVRANVCIYESLNNTSTNEINYVGNITDLIPTGNEIPYINISNKVNYYFANFFYDAPFSIYNIGFFAGLGAGVAQINLSSTSNLPINLTGKATTPAYQYKIGSYFNINDSENLRLLVALTHINTVGDIKFSNFTMSPISQNSVDFSLMFLL